MLTDVQLETLSRNFMRIFALPISRLTILEVRNSLTETLPNDTEKAKSILESLLTGNIPDSLKTNGDSDLDNFVEKYSPYVRFAKDVSEKGEFMNTFSCEFFQQGNQVYFINRMRRLDGEEYYFLSAPETNIRLAHMFINRLRDLKKAVGGVRIEAGLLKEIEKIKTDAEALLNN
jgi:hypothetical protein